jgi:hypothetical protein
VNSVMNFVTRAGIFLFFAAVSRPGLGPAQPPIQWVTGSLPSGVKQAGREADHTPSPSAEVKNEWMYTSSSPYIFMAWCLVKNRRICTFYSRYWS